LTAVSCTTKSPQQIDLFRIGFDKALWTSFWNG
jgi:hypothetical protein